jgi:hypothetical protein
MMHVIFVVGIEADVQFSRPVFFSFFHMCVFGDLSLFLMFVFTVIVIDVLKHFFFSLFLLL